MIEHVYRRAARARGVDAVVVATDDERIAAAVERFGGVVRMTAAHHQTGTDRIAEVARDLTCRIVVNVQGDLPLIAPDMIVEVIEPLARDDAAPMSTLRRAIVDPAEYRNPHVVKVVVDGRGDALYFSRATIPYLRGPGPPEGGHLTGSPEAPSVMAAFRPPVYKHIGLYAFRRDFLLTFAALPRTPLEQAESLEQLRALEHGYRIGTVETRHESIEVDTPDDLERVRRSIAVAAPA
jgi:3-deoxy-manno-octulosonate cytidylyltransferase (CMP-KDO synthetase)